MLKRWEVPLAAVGLLCVLTFCLGGDFVFQGVFLILCGWVLYLIRVVPQVVVDPAGAITAVVCLSLLAAGLHLFLRWLYAKVREARPAPEGVSPRWRMRWTATILGLVVLAFTAGISAVGITHQVAWVLSSPGRLLRRDGGIG